MQTVPVAQPSLFPPPALSEPAPGWRPPDLPDLSGERHLYVDTETTGLQWWRKDRPTGFSVATEDGRSWYFPVRHAGGNLDEARVLEWTRSDHGLKGKHLDAFATRFDCHMFRVFGADLEELGCTVGDVAFWATLLDDHRVSTTLDAVCEDFLPFKKVQGLDKKRMADYHASQVAEYAKRDVLLLRELRIVLWPKLDAEDLHRVRQLEEDVIFATVEMEKNGSPLDEEKLARWLKQSEHDYVACVWKIRELTGLTVNPMSREDAKVLFAKCGVKPTMQTPSGEPSFTKASIKRIKHPVVAQYRRAKALGSLRAKFLLPYWRELKRHGRLLYALHQLPVDDEGGTVSGRYSSSSFGDDEGDGRNIQQVAGKKHANANREDELGDLEYKVRELHVAKEGQVLSADAEQIEYRFFAHYAKPPKVLAAYERDPGTDFHNFVWEMVKAVEPTVTRELTKDLNFAKIYGAGLPRIAEMLGFRRLGLPKEDDEGIAEVRPFVNAYDQAFPEAKRLLWHAKELAETRGYVKTMLGRRARFLEYESKHSALNRVIQGSAADEMKLKLRELHRERKRTGFVLRFTVHDEAGGDAPDAESARMVHEVLNRQLMPTRVPLRWAVKVGPNWNECKPLKEAA